MFAECHAPQAESAFWSPALVFYYVFKIRGNKAEATLRRQVWTPPSSA